MNTTDLDLRFTLGDRMRKSRQASGWTNEAIAARLDVTPQTVSRWIGDRGGRPSMGVLMAWAQITGAPLSWLIGEDEHAGTAA